LCINVKLHSEKGGFAILIFIEGDTVVKVAGLGVVAGKTCFVSLDHAWITAVRSLGTCLGDELPNGY